LEVGAKLPAKAGVPAAMERWLQPAASLRAPTFNHTRAVELTLNFRP